MSLLTKYRKWCSLNTGSNPVLTIHINNPMKHLKLFERFTDDIDNPNSLSKERCTILPVNRTTGTALSQSIIRRTKVQHDSIKNRFDTDPDAYPRASTRTIQTRVLDQDSASLLKYEPLLSLSPEEFDEFRLDAREKAIDFVNANGLELLNPNRAESRNYAYFMLPNRLKQTWKSYCETELSKLIKTYA